MSSWDSCPKANQTLDVSLLWPERTVWGGKKSATRLPPAQRGVQHGFSGLNPLNSKSLSSLQKCGGHLTRRRTRAWPKRLRSESCKSLHIYNKPRKKLKLNAFKWQINSTYEINNIQVQQVYLWAKKPCSSPASFNYEPAAYCDYRKTPHEFYSMALSSKREAFTSSSLSGRHLE